MFGLSFSSCQLIQGPAVRTWNRVAHFANLIWYKFNHVGYPIMPRARRRHHSRSRTRSRSHSYDRDREPKRRKIESFESPQHKRSLSHDPKEENEEQIETIEDVKEIQEENEDVSTEDKSADSSTIKGLDTTTADSESEESEAEVLDKSSDLDVSKDVPKDDDVVAVEDEVGKGNKKSVTSKVSEATITPKKTLSPNQLKKKLESEKRREEQRLEREKKKEELLKQKQEKQKMREEKEQQKLKEKQEKQEQKLKEIEEKQKEKEMKEEKKKKEREEKELKRKERDEQKRKEVEEKNKEKLKLEEKKQKAAAVFANFFTKKTEMDEKKEELESSSTFMPFEVKSDMRLAPLVRKKLSETQKTTLTTSMQKQTGNIYLDELKAGKETGKGTKTFLPEDPNIPDDVIIIEDVNPGESIESQSKTTEKMRAKFLKFADNRRPPYFGTWRKKSKFVKPRKPLALDKEYFDYDIDSDEDWEVGEDTGESLRGSDDEDKENDSENEYEVDDEFFVPHGHLSDDEVNDEEDAVVSPEAHKAKLKLLKKEFEEEMKGKTQKIKPRVIGCIWYSKDNTNVDKAIDEFLKPLSIISNGQISIKKRSKLNLQPFRKIGKELDDGLIPDFLKLIHGNTNNRKSVVTEFLKQLNEKNVGADVSKARLSKQMKQLAEWMRCPEDGPLPNKFCWIVRANVKKEFKFEPSPEKK